MIGIISNVFVMGLIAAIVTILINSALILYLSKLLNFHDQTYRSAFMVALFLGALSLVISFAAILFPLRPIIIESIGIILFAFTAFQLAKWQYKNQTQKELYAFSGFLILFAFLLSFVTLFLVTSFVNTLGF